MINKCLNTAGLSNLRQTFHSNQLSNTIRLSFTSRRQSRQKNNNFLRSHLQHSQFRPQSAQEMDNVTKVWSGPLPKDSPYVQPFRLYFVQNGVEKNWDLLKVHDSVAIIIFNKTRNVLVFVKQFRPAVYYGVITSAGCGLGDVDLNKFPPKLGITLELCAGIVDKDKTWVEIAREEMIEECGYDVSADRIEKVMAFRSGVGSSGALQQMYYCEVTDNDKVNSGGGVDEEVIEVVEYSVEQARGLLVQGSKINSPPSFLFGVLWFLTNKAPQTI